MKTKIKGLNVALGFILASSLIGCTTEETSIEELNTGREELTTNVEPKDGELVTIEWKGAQFQATKEGDVYVVDDQHWDKNDVTVISDSSTSTGVLKSVARTDVLWPNNTMFYTISNQLPSANRDRVRGAIEHWEENTNVKFVQRTNQQAYVEFVPGSGCSSAIGRRGRRQTINLAPGCSLGSTIHEIGHAVGLFHEQSRADRDEFVIVNFDNIQPGLENNFQKWTTRTRNGADLTPALDFGSIMMYNSFAFSNNRQPTITRRDGSTYRVQRSVLSEGDLAGINILYPPTDEPTPTPPPTTPTPPTTGNGSGDNVALGRPTTQSSTAFSGASSRAVDGNTNGIYTNRSVSHTRNSSQPFWRVDLDETTSIERVVIFNRTDNCCVERLSDFVVEALNESGAVVGSLFVSDAPTPSLTIRGNGIRAKSIRIRLTGTDPLSLAEVQVIKR